MFCFFVLGLPTYSHILLVARFQGSLSARLSRNNLHTNLIDYKRLCLHRVNKYQSSYELFQVHMSSIFFMYEEMDKNMQNNFIDYRGSQSWCVIGLVKPNCNKHAMCLLIHVLVTQ